MNRKTTLFLISKLLILEEKLCTDFFPQCRLGILQSLVHMWEKHILGILVRFEVILDCQKSTCFRVKRGNIERSKLPPERSKLPPWGNFGPSKLPHRATLNVQSCPVRSMLPHGGISPSGRFCPGATLNIFFTYDLCFLFGKNTSCMF